jgi:hypothetical protein
MARPFACSLALLLAVHVGPTWADDGASVVPSQDEVRAMDEDRLDSKRLEAELQGMRWEQFRAVIEAIPKLKADVDAYGPAGWEYVKGKYKTYGWHKNIDKLDGEEKRRLAALIESQEKR